MTRHVDKFFYYPWQGVWKWQSVWSEIKLVTVNWVLIFSGLADLYSMTSENLCFFFFRLVVSSTVITSALQVLQPSSWRLRKKNSSLRYLLKGSYMVRYSFYCASTCTLAKAVQLLYGIGLYCGIFAMYLQFQSEKSRTSTIIFYAVCLLYLLSTLSFVSDLLALILEVSDNAIYKNINFLSAV